MAKFPAKLGARIDAARALREKRLEFQRESEATLAEMKKREFEIRESIIADLKKSGMESGRGSNTTATIVKAILPRPVDWPSIYKWVDKTKAFEIFERRISKSAFKERYEAKDFIPGIEAYEDEDLSLTKAGGK